MKFIKASKEYRPYYWMFEFFLETGCRSGEGTGLLWGNIDFRKKFIQIGHQLLYKLDEEGKRRFQICPPKTIRGIRKIPLTTKALQALKTQKEYMLKHGMLENYTVDSHSGFVFLTKRFQLWSVAQLDSILHRIVYDYKRMRDEIEKFDAKRDGKEKVS